MFEREVHQILVARLRIRRKIHVKSRAVNRRPRVLWICHQIRRLNRSEVAAAATLLLLLLIHDLAEHSFQLRLRVQVFVLNGEQRFLGDEDGLRCGLRDQGVTSAGAEHPVDELHRSGDFIIVVTVDVFAGNFISRPRSPFLLVFALLFDFFRVRRR